MLLPAAFAQEAAGDWDAAASAAAAARSCGERLRDADLCALAGHEEGHIHVRRGRVQDGLRLLDEAMVAAGGGELSPIVTGIVYCGVILACQEAHEVGRAQEWTATLGAWCDEQAEMVAFTGRCRIHRAEILQLRGEWTEALAEARGAIRRSLQAESASAAGEACYRQGEVHRLRGDLPRAERSYRDASAHGREPQPGLALLRLAHGEAERARSCIARALAETEESLARVWLLPAAVDIELAAGDVERAEAAARELQEIGERYSSPLVLAGASCAAGAVALARGRANAARESLRVGRRIWQDLDAPYEAGQARVRLALAYRAAGDEEAARLELGSARSTFVRLGAVPALQTVEALLEPELTARPGT
jgi:tetratricopeptide (TPR) repeat protein